MKEKKRKKSLGQKIVRELLRPWRKTSARTRQTWEAAIRWGRLRAAHVRNERRMKEDYATGALAHEPDDFVLIRIIGNDLPPRHKSDQTLVNVEFILRNEPELDACTRHWVVNKIDDDIQKERIIDLLAAYGQSYDVIEFDLDDYARQPMEYRDPASKAFERTDVDYLVEASIRRLKNRFAINNNGARNFALEAGRGRAKWVLPWDGNCFVTRRAWAQITATIRQKPHYPYFVVPMARVEENARLLDDTFVPVAKEEPQIVFRRDAAEIFDENYVYGRRPKVELLWRLGVPGPWDRFPILEFDLPRPPLSADAGCVATCGWVARLVSGRADLENGTRTLKTRGDERNKGIVLHLDKLDARVAARAMDRDRPSFFDPDRLEAAAQGAYPHVVECLLADADRALTRGPYSVTHKTTLPPSGDPHDYWSVAPYWWPDPNTPDGLPYIFRDGHRIRGTELFDEGSEKFDRTELQLMLDDTTALALAWRVTGEERYARHAAKLLVTWFVDPQTRMNPHLTYAQVRRGHNNDEGSSTGIIEASDIYYFLDAVRLIYRAGALDGHEKAAFEDWLRQYGAWLAESPQGRQERRRKNNHGTIFDLQQGAIALFLGDAGTIADIWRRAQLRVLQQFNEDGFQPLEFKRTRSMHYCCFNLQAFANLCRLLDNAGFDAWHLIRGDAPALKLAMEWFFANAPDYRAGEDFDFDRMAPLLADYRDRYGDEAGNLDALSADVTAHPRYSCHYMIVPYWPFLRGGPSRAPAAS